MATFLGSVKSKFDYLDDFHQSVLNLLKKEVKSVPTAKLRVALNDLEESRIKYGKKATIRENLYNASQQDIIKKEIESRK